MPKEPVDFGLITGYNSPNGVEFPKPPIAENYDHSFANWLVAVRGYTPHNAKLASYRMRTLTNGAYPHTKEEAEALGASIMIDPEMAKSTKRGYLYSIERWMEYLGVLVKFLHKPRPTARCPHYLDQAQLQTFIRAAKDYREFAILSTFIYTGARLNEVRMLDMRDIDFSKKQILIRHAKLDKERYVPLDEALERVLKAPTLGSSRPTSVCSILPYSRPASGAG
jgi:integrase